MRSGGPQVNDHPLRRLDAVSAQYRPKLPNPQFAGRAAFAEREGQLRIVSRRRRQTALVFEQGPPLSSLSGPGVVGGIVCTRVATIAVAILCTATVASAQAPSPLPSRLVGQYTLKADRYNETSVMPIDLEDIKVNGEMVTGIVANYRGAGGNCVSNKTRFTGTYKNGQLSALSMPMLNQSADGKPCAGIAINVRVSAGRASGTYKVGDQNGPIEFEAK